jgi:hypothetical protein
MKSLSKYITEQSDEVKVFDHRRKVQDAIMEWIEKNGKSIFPDEDTRVHYKLDDYWFLTFSHGMEDENNGVLGITLTSSDNRYEYRYYNYMSYDKRKNNDFEKTLSKILFQACEYNNTYSAYVYQYQDSDVKQLKRLMYQDDEFGNVEIYDIKKVIRI